jgi:hypothetical protein
MFRAVSKIVIPQPVSPEVRKARAEGGRIMNFELHSKANF